jgi:hypothetical protein
MTPSPDGISLSRQRTGRLKRPVAVMAAPGSPTAASDDLEFDPAKNWVAAFPCGAPATQRPFGKKGCPGRRWRQPSRRDLPHPFRIATSLLPSASKTSVASNRTISDSIRIAPVEFVVHTVVVSGVECAHRPEQSVDEPQQPQSPERGCKYSPSPTTPLR